LDLSKLVQSQLSLELRDLVNSHHSHVQEDDEKGGSNIGISHVKLGRRVCPVCEGEHVITKDNKDEFVNHLKSILDFGVVWSHHSEPN
jgi:hypothetical protein